MKARLNLGFSLLCIMTKDELIQARLEQIREFISTQEQALAIISPSGLEKHCSIRDNDCDIRLILLVKSMPEANLKVSEDQDLHDDIHWLADIQHIAYEFKRSPGHFRFLFSDGLFCDFTVMNEQELALDSLQHGEILWRRDVCPASLDKVIQTDTQYLQPNVIKHEESCWLLGEFLTNLLIGLRRYSKGDKLSAFYLIQHNALTQLLELVDKWESKAGQHKSIAANADESFETNYPQLVPLVEEFAKGYDHSPKSAHAMLQYAEQHDTINFFIKDQILNLIKPHSNLH